MRYNQLLYLLFFQCLSITLSGQYVQKMTIKLDENRDKNTNTDSIFLISPGYEMTGVVLRISPESSFDKAYIISGKDTFYLSMDEHVLNRDEFLTSNLVVFSYRVSSFYINAGAIADSIQFNFINADYRPEVKEKNRPKRLKKKALDGGCSEPEMIDQDIWREGLPAPEYVRIVHDVYNIIIHHSAGSNTDTNYTNVIRNIYLYHTQVNGWSDIGYNYVVVQNGLVYKGRDPAEYEQDNIKGAHFCGSNTGTMGICLLGNYMEAMVPQPALLSIVDLLAWKLAKDTLNPLGTHPHPLNALLPVVAGHRDGCATLCPGDDLYNKLDSIRQSASELLLACGFDFTGEKAITEESYVCRMYPNPAGNDLKIYSTGTHILKILIYDGLGRLHKTQIIYPVEDHANVSLEALPSGFYTATVICEKFIYRKVIQVIKQP